MNVADSEVVYAIMQTAGYEATDNLDQADAVFLNTCSVAGEMPEQKIINRLAQLRQLRKKKRTPPCYRCAGLYAERVREKLLNEHFADLVVGPDAHLELPNLVGVPKEEGICSLM